jgi:hypothetical protein
MILWKKFLMAAKQVWLWMSCWNDIFSRGIPYINFSAEVVSMNSLACRVPKAPGVTNRALGPTIGPALQFTKSSGYDRVDEERLKAEQSATTDLPLHALTVEMREGILTAAAATLKSPFGQVPAGYLKRTAHALASLEPQSKSEQAATMGCLPAFASMISFAVKKQSTALTSATTRRQLLPPPKTAFLPAEDPLELRQIIEEMQQKRSQSLDKARITSRMQALSLPVEQSVNPSHSFLALRLKDLTFFNFRFSFKRLGALLGDLIDKLAVA